MRDQVFYYLCNCHDEGFLPDIDTLSDQFPNLDRDVLEDEYNSFASIHDLSETKILWEGVLSCSSIN